MRDFVVLGTDTDCGKTTFALLWLEAFSDDYDYWKPIETGPSDSRTIHSLLPDVVVHPPYRHFDEPVAPPLAARNSGVVLPAALELAANKPTLAGRSLLIESFGSPFSPLNDDESQITLLQALRLPMVLVSSSKLGAIGRTRQCWIALQAQGLTPCAVVLLGPRDDYAAEELGRDLPVVCLERPPTYDRSGIKETAASQNDKLVSLHGLLLGFQAEPENEGIVARDHAVVWHPYSPLADPEPPLPVVGAQDEFLELADGRRVIDGISSWWTILHGHRHPPLVAALREALGVIDHVHFAGVTHPWAVELAELLLATMPWKGGRVFYSDNGSTAVEVALKMAYQFWCHHGENHRTRFIGFEHGYHGDTFGAMAVSRDPVFFGRFEPLLFQADILPLVADRLEDHLNRYRGNIAAVILEPLVQGAGGMRMHSPEILRAIFEVTRRHDVLFIADEVMTGGGRTGTLWAFQAAGIAPDLVCAAKTLAGGMLPLAATLASPRIVEAFETPDRTRTFFHGHSFTAHPLACAVACVNWKLLTQSLPTAPGRMERFWTESLATLRQQARVKEVRVRGSIAAVELDVSGGYHADVGRHMRQQCFEKGVLLRPLGNVLYALPPYCTSEASILRIAEAMIEAIVSGEP